MRCARAWTPLRSLVLLSLFAFMGVFFTSRPLAAQASSNSSSSSTSSSSHSSSSSFKKKSKKHHSPKEPSQKAPTPDRISEIQSALNRGGYYQGDSNGKWDANTIAAMQKFQSANGLEPTGKLDALSLQKLGLGSSTAGVSAPKPPAPASCSGCAPASSGHTCCSASPSSTVAPSCCSALVASSPKPAPAPASDVKPDAPPDKSQQ
jgi:peptidoglycan hydrolase-like protein with peptidoglycan-binding domain